MPRFCILIYNKPTRKIFRKKNFRKFQKAKLELDWHQQLLTEQFHCIYKYLHIIYIVLATIHKLESIQSIWEDMTRLYANTVPFYTRDLSILGLLQLRGPGTNSPRISRDNYTHDLYRPCLQKRYILTLNQSNCSSLFS